MGADQPRWLLLETGCPGAHEDGQPVQHGLAGLGRRLAALQEDAAAKVALLKKEEKKRAGLEKEMHIATENSIVQKTYKKLWLIAV